jgi:hypothetical protein
LVSTSILLQIELYKLIKGIILKQILEIF